MSLSELWSLYGQNYIDALLATWGMTLESFVIAMVLAVAVTVMRVSPLKPLRVFGDLYVQVFRNIPGIALLIIVVYALPPLKVVLPYRTCVIVATVLLGSAFGSENFMSGINTVGVGQVEAARSLGMSFNRILAKIVYDGSYHEVDSSEMAFHIAGSLAFKDAMKKASPVLLEPIMRVEVTMPEEYMGDVIGDINSRRGRIEGMDDLGGGKIVRGFVPLSEMFGYSTDLRSRTQGRGNYSMFFEKYEPVPKSVQEKILSSKND